MTGWSLAWRLARRDLSARFRGLRLLLVCLLLGVGALAAIGSLSAAVSGELASRGRVILGGDLEFAAGQRGADPEELRLFRSLGRVSETVRMQANAVAGGRAAPVELKGVDGAYPLTGELTLRDGRRVGTPGADAVWIGQGLADRLSLRVGDPVRFGVAQFRVGGIIGTEPDRLGEGFTLGPVAIASSEGIRRSELVQPGSLYETKVRVALPAGANLAAVQARAEAELAEGAWEVKTRDRAAPGAERFLQRMGEFLTLVGLAALTIAGVGVAGGVSAYLRARRGAIATLKVLGADSATIARVYLLQIVAVALVGIVGGLLIGVVATPVAVWAAGDLLPVAPGFRLHPAPLMLAAAYGLLVALAFCVRPLADAGAVPAAGLLRADLDNRGAPLRRWLPWAALAGAGVVALAVGGSNRPLWAGAFLGAMAGVVLLLLALGWAIRAVAARAPRSRQPLLRLAVAALHRPGARTGALVVALGLGLTLFVLLAGIRTSLDANIARTVPARAPALFALDVPREREAEFRQVVRSVAPQAEVATVPALRGTVVAYRDTRVADLAELPEGAWALGGERGLTYAETLPPGSELVEGRWWSRGYDGPPLLSVDEQLARAIGLKIGDPVTVSVLGAERTARVASFRRVNWDTLGFNFVLVFSPNAFRDVPHNLAATIDMPPGREGAVTAALLPRFPSTSVVEVGGVLAQVRDVVGQMAAAIAAAAGVAVAAGLAVLVGAIAATREARTYDGVVLKTLGATRWQVLGAQAIEYLLLSLVLAGVALALGIGGAWGVVTQLFDFQWLPDWGAIGAVLGGGVALVLLFGLGGALPTLSARPARALRAL